ncbi:MAG TPA: hypothetical protein VFG87_07130, partial [Amycolatopsis sp.]|nr:hypothetical protein [Amycolatopsis sp.]
MPELTESPTVRTPRPARFLGRIGGGYSWLAMLWLWLIYAMNTNTRNWIQLVQPAVVEEFHLSSTTMGVLSGALTMGLGVAGVALSPWLA